MVFYYIIETVASEENRMPQMVEKDTIQSMILFELSKCEFPLVFKGGTSLSKVYGLIERFSEDITYEDAINKGIAKITNMDIFDYREKRL